MSVDMYPLVLILLMVCSAFFSSAETAFSSLNKIKLKNKANNDDLRAAKTLEIAEDFSKFISTVLIGNNIVNIVSTALATVYFTVYFGDNGAAVSSLVMTVAVLIFGEILPKRLVKLYPEKYAMAITPFIHFLMIILTPLSFIFEGIGNLFEKIFKKEDEEDFNSEELVTMVEEAESQGDMDEHEAEIITNAIEFNDLDVGEIFTPRVDVISCSNKDSLEEIEKKFRETGFSRLPYYKDTIDNIVGVIHEKDFYSLYYNKSKTRLTQILQNVIFTSKSVKISTLLRQLQSNKSHMAVVVDEYGGTEGIITMEDILEELVGEIYDEHDEVVEYFKKVNDTTYIVDCDADIEDFFDYLGINYKEEYDFNTVAGFVNEHFDSIPSIGDEFEFEDFRIEVTEADQRQVKEVKVNRIEKPQEENASENKLMDFFKKDED